ncbi:MAG: hypothetical protein US53_C0055G0009 [Candidatus Woesebacteria bacterium GW2011_GWA1_37_7]|uniref:Uncharacterized protein n=1 Tax=Candidatus Woesebacteria bacterium GW2011_GWA1_37_7 TaxID=1618545 RepID=A0A0G0GZH0_9BACT|nr:MAG: hypothetical protein US53_C0055G0009 [Candidatus Woesebacteria bacterium GW2011_GWA1_37_7]
MSPIRRETIQLKVESYTVRAGPKGTRTIRHKSIVAEGDDLDPELGYCMPTSLKMAHENP